MADSEDAYSSDSGTKIGTDSGGWKSSKLAKGIKSAGKSLTQTGNQQLSQSTGEAASRVGPVQYKRGGKIRKSKVRGGAVPIIAHENERVIPADKRKKVERLMKRSGMNLTNKKRKKGRGKGRTERG
jgi:hypothetical protein